jgi:hypothetical protein
MPTPSLRELQGLFWHSIAGPTRGLGFAPALLEVSEPSATLAPAARLRVYADAYFWRLRDVLAEDFPRVAAILGPERFEALAREYLRSHPSEHPSVRYLGRDLAAVIARHVDLPPYLADLARLERARLDVFDALDCEPLRTDALRAVQAEDWPQLRFAPIPALAVLQADWPVHEAWGGADAASLASAPTFVRVWRAQDYRVYHTPMDARDAEALDRLMAGAPFEIVCTAFDDLPPLEGAQRAAALLARWLEDGIIARVV